MTPASPRRAGRGSGAPMQVRRTLAALKGRRPEPAYIADERSLLFRCAEIAPAISDCLNCRANPGQPLEEVTLWSPAKLLRPTYMWARSSAFCVYFGILKS